MTTAGGPDRELRVASWPGPDGQQNAFIGVFLDGLAGAGCRVEPLGSVADVAAALARPAPPDILLLHWAERVFAEPGSRWQALARIGQLLVALRRRRRTRIAWLVHNLAPHDARAFQRLVWRPYVAALARQADGFLTLAPGTVEVVRDALPGLAAKPAAGIWHPAYPGATLTAEERAAARAGLGLAPDELVVGYCGQIRPYKGVEDLVAAFAAAPGPGRRLLVAGQPRTDRPGAAQFRARLEAAAAADRRIELRLGAMPADAFRTTLGACDVVAAPLRGYLHSGSIVHALSAGRPVLTPATPFAESYRALLGTGWLRLYQGALTPALLASQGPPPAAPPDLAALAPAAVGAAAAGFLRELAA